MAIMNWPDFSPGTSITTNNYESFRNIHFDQGHAIIYQFIESFKGCTERCINKITKYNIKIRRNIFNKDNIRSDKMVQY